MKPVFQTRFGGSDSLAEEQGNCLAACLASIFELTLDEVPDPIMDEGAEWFREIQDWLRERNLWIVALEGVFAYEHAAYTILSCKSTVLPGEKHVVVAYNGEVVHDPSPRAKSVGEIEQTWVFAVLNPASAILLTKEPG